MLLAFYSCTRKMSSSYIGSIISLVSKAQIRYEGTLHSVDGSESTITLSKVRTFGTEDRVTDHPMPPRNEVFEFIIFKATDIEDIVVCETPQTYLVSPPFDPAIVSMSKGVTSQSNLQQPGHLSTNIAGAPAKFPSALSSRSMSPIGAQQRKSGQIAAYDVTSPPPPPPQNRAPGAGRLEASRQQQQQRSVVGGGGAFRSQTTHGYFNASRRNDDDVESVDEVRSRGANAARESQTNMYHPRDSYRRGGNLGGFHMGGVRGGYAAAVASSLAQYDRYGFNNRGGAHGPSDYQIRRPEGSGGGFIYRGHVNRGGNFRGTHYQHQNARRFDTDYDFEKANEKFKQTLNELKEGVARAKLEDGKENRDSNEIGAVDQSQRKTSDAGSETRIAPTVDSLLKSQQSYNKAKSFFDNISCEALENLEGANMRPTWRRERELNQETFGQTGMRNFQYRRGAVQRGRRGSYGASDQRNFNRYR